MKGFNFISRLTYTYEMSPQQLQDILNQDGYQNYVINQQQGIVEYEIDNSRVIRLDNFLYLINIYYLKITTAQLFQLCLMIVQKYLTMKSNSIKHTYLAKNRILLNLDKNCPSISILPQKLFYTIHFTGYDCPFYEKQNINKFYNQQQSTDEIVIKQIIEEILKCNLFYSKQEFQENINNLKYQLNVSFDSFIQKIQQIFNQYSNVNNEHQILYQIDNKFSDGNFKREIREKDVQENLKNLKNLYYTEKNDWYSYEQRLYQTIPLITQEFRHAKYYSQQKFPQHSKIYESKNYIHQIDSNKIKNLINIMFQNVSAYYKFEWSQDILIKDIQDVLQQEYIKLQYFQNDINFHKFGTSFEEKIQEFQTNLMNKVTNEVFQMYLKLQFLLFINELI